jgi:hypothetical protein
MTVREGTRVINCGLRMMQKKGVMVFNATLNNISVILWRLMQKGSLVGQIVWVKASVCQILS